MNILHIYNDLKKLMHEEHVFQNEPLKKYTFTKTGGHADLLVLPTSYSEVEAVYKYAKQNDLPLTILGNGSNLIIRDGGIRGIVMILTKLNQIIVDGNRIIAQSGATIIDVSRTAQAHNLTGLEFACGIPGTAGGALFMNAGAYGGEVKDVLESAIVLDEEGNLRTLSKDEFDFGYRTSAFAKKNYCVLEGTFLCETGDATSIKEKMDELTYLRESKQPLEYPSCGSVFKRPPGHFAGKLIQDSDLQGVQIGGVQVSTKHAGFMVNVDHGTASDYIELIQHVQKTVYEKFGIQLETEVKIIGEN
ncbi:UDP-N-acetylmuramate dehydrogenase [Bacillus massiliigorillae]|uniref:UDP-N-acetylmuramate dehydrogenase n=1 Tax=Bacillus massiliigorillae TaxID=1243664 RepID=UPI00039B07C9|nr:UDP-N-acetylmuramate dehydrogenase [Bacillus massiliigorillae]